MTHKEVLRTLNVLGAYKRQVRLEKVGNSIEVWIHFVFEGNPCKIKVETFGG